MFFCCFYKGEQFFGLLWIESAHKEKDLHLRDQFFSIDLSPIEKVGKNENARITASEGGTQLLKKGSMKKKSTFTMC